MNPVRRFAPGDFLPILLLGLFLVPAVSYAEPMGSMKFVDVEGIRTGYFEGGSGEPMVLVHGGHFGSTVSSNGWRPVFDHLSRHFHVYALDKLGQGYTDNPKTDADYTMLAVTRHIFRFIQALGLGEVHLAGHSRGALPTTRIAVDHPEAVKTLILFDSNTLAPDEPDRMRSNPGPPPAASEPPAPTRESIRESLLSNPDVYHKQYVTDEYVDAELKLALLPKLQEATERMRVLTERWANQNPARVKELPGLRNRWWYYDMKQETFQKIEEGRLTAPTLIIWGYNDPSASHRLGINLYNIFAGKTERVELHFFNRSGHYVFQEYPAETADLMLGFIRNAGR